MPENFKISYLSSEASVDQVASVARGIRKSLVEVLGEKLGSEIYTMEWLENRVRQHTSGELKGAVLLLKNHKDRTVGQMLIRVDKNALYQVAALFSSIYVAVDSRKEGVGAQLLREGEVWAKKKGLKRSVSRTSQLNYPLVSLFEKNGYGITAFFDEEDMLEVSKSL